jgi:hypothetical protein
MNIRSIFTVAAGLLAVAGTLAFAPVATAGNVAWNLSVAVPGLALGVGQPGFVGPGWIAPPVIAPAPIWAPAPVYAPPRVVVAPRPIVHPYAYRGYRAAVPRVVAPHRVVVRRAGPGYRRY